MNTSVNYVPVATAPRLSTAPPIGFIGANQSNQSALETPPPSYSEVYKGLNPHNPVLNINPTGDGPQFEPIAPRYDVVPVHLTRESTWLVCPYCFKQTMTDTDEDYSELVQCCCCLLCLIGCPLCLCLLPFYASSPERVHHSCKECKQYIGISYEDNPLLWNRLREIRREEGHAE